MIYNRFDFGTFDEKNDGLHEQIYPVLSRFHFYHALTPGISSSAEPIIRADDEEIAQWQAMRLRETGWKNKKTLSMEHVADRSRRVVKIHKKHRHDLQ